MCSSYAALLICGFFQEYFKDLRICLPMLGMQVQSLVKELRSHTATEEPNWKAHIWQQEALVPQWRPCTNEYFIVSFQSYFASHSYIDLSNHYVQIKKKKAPLPQIGGLEQHKYILYSFIYSLCQSPGLKWR